jgi:uridine kinase
VAGDAALDGLLQRVEGLLRAKDRAVIAVSGFGGSGKTTLAQTIAGVFTEAVVLPLDHFLVNRGRGPGWQGGFDWRRLELVLREVGRGGWIRYQQYQWEPDALGGWVEHPPPRLTIVEGVRLLQPSLLRYFDLSVWIACPPALATERGKARDRLDLAGESAATIDRHLARWDADWTPKDVEFERLFHPQQLADVVYDCRSAGAPGVR